MPSEKIPVNIISGFLGAGKTTAIIELLSAKSTTDEWAVIINEFGKISIDGQTLRSASASGRIFDISGGCICCTARGYLMQNLEEIIAEGKYSRIIIEPSGLGGIEMVSDIVKDNPLVTLHPVICMVDITGVDNQRLQMNMMYKMQISKSDVVVFSKTDLVKSEDELRLRIEKFKTANPQVKIASQGINISILDNDNAEEKVPVSPKSLRFSVIDPTLSADKYIEIVLVFDASVILNTETLSQLLSAQSAIVRAKGFVKTVRGWELLNYTLTHCLYESCPPAEQTEIVVIAEKSDTDLGTNLRTEILKTCL